MTTAQLTRWARLVALALIIGIGIVNLTWAVTAWTLSDAQVYWDAGLRLRGGGPLYPDPDGADTATLYRYAPWFAWLAVAWTYLPPWLAGTLWSAVLLAASGAALLPLVRARAWVALAFFGPILVGISAVGNVHPLIVAGLVHAVDRRAGPFMIGLAASLKIFPLLLAVVYLGRREWGRAALSVAVAGLLWAPAFVLHDMGGYPTDAGPAAFLWSWPPLYAVVVAGALVIAAALARSRYAWLAGAGAVALSLPRFFVYDVTYLLVGVRGTPAAAGSGRGRHTPRTSQPTGRLRG